jgi:hypothetical protein
MTDDQARDAALRLLRVARDIHVEAHSGDVGSFRAKTPQDLVAAGGHTGLPTGYPSHEAAVEWLESSGAIEPIPAFQAVEGITGYRITARGVGMLRT